MTKHNEFAQHRPGKYTSNGFVPAKAVRPARKSLFTILVTFFFGG